MATTAIEAEGGDAGGGGGGDAAAAAAAAAGAGGGEALPFYESFTKEALKTSPSVQKFKTPEDLADAYVNLEKRYGIDPARRIDLPADPKDAAAMREVYAKLGMPEKPDGYGFKLDDKATPADKEFLGRALDTLHAAGLATPQAEAVFKFWQGEAAQAAQASADAMAARMAEGKAALEKEWGQAYEPRSREIGRLLDTYADDGLKAELAGDKLGNYPNLAIMLGKILDRMAEPGALGGDAQERHEGGALTPAQAKAEAKKWEDHPAFRDPSKAQHKEVVAARNAALAMAEGRTS